MPKPLFAVQTGARAPALRAVSIPEQATQPKRVKRRQSKNGATFTVESTPQLENVIDQICKLWGTSDRRAVFEMLVDQQLKSGFMNMAGLKQGPRLIVDNTKPAKG